MVVWGVPSCSVLGKTGNYSGRRAKGGRARQFGKSLASQRKRLAIVPVGGPRVAEQDSLASLLQVKGEDLQSVWRESQGWQSKMVWQVFGKSKEKIGDCSGGRAKGGRAREEVVAKQLLMVNPF